MVIMICWKLFAPFAPVRAAKRRRQYLGSITGKEGGAGNDSSDFVDGNVMFFKLRPDWCGHMTPDRSERRSWPT